MSKTESEMDSTINSSSDELDVTIIKKTKGVYSQ